jgi:hypothetical protein
MQIPSGNALATAMIWLGLAALVAAQESPAAGAHKQAPVLSAVQAVRVAAPIVLDGRLDDSAWNQAPAASEFFQRDPDEGKPATERTEVRVAYDEDALYLGLRLFDQEPGRIVRNLSRRDEGAEADRVVVYLDPRHDHLTGAWFQVSAAGVQSDAIIFNDSWDDGSWDGVWESAVSTDDQGWTSELRIPFSQLRFTTAEQQTWGINISRYIQRKNETAWLQLVPKKESGLASRMAHLTGLEGIRSRHHLSLLPYTVARSELIAPSASGNPFNDGSRHGLGMGLDVKYGLTSNLTLDATVNPDFGQVEVDPAVVNLSEFETFFDEKRPFFIEGSQIFGNFGRNGANNFWGFNRSEPDIFYSRRIGRAPQGSASGDHVDRPSAATIFGAAKITGKTAGGWSLGLLDAVTGREHAQVQAGGLRSAPEIEPLTNYVVARAHREVASGRAGFGALATGVMRDLRTQALSDLIVSQAYVAGLDGYVFLDQKKTWAVAGRIAWSRLQGSETVLQRIQHAPQRYFQRPDLEKARFDPTATSLSGWTGSLNLNRNSGHKQVNAAVWATSPGFESNDLGFNGRSDRWGAHVVGTWKKPDPDKLTRSRSVSLAKWWSLNFENQRQGDGAYVFWNAQFRNYWYTGGNAFHRWRTHNDGLTRGGPSTLGPAGHGGGSWVETDSRKVASVVLESFYNNNEYGGWSHSSFASLKVKPSSSLSFSVGPGLNRNRTVAQWVTSLDDPAAVSTFGRRYVFADLKHTELVMSTRFSWIVSPRMSLQLYAQPLISAGDYRDFKELARPRSYDFHRYGADTGTLTDNPARQEYTVDPDGAGPAAPFTVEDPDFNFKSLRVNAVFRWEWRPGTTFYAVWTQNRQDSETLGRFDLGNDTADLFQAPADDVFLVKFSYRFAR